MKAYKIQRPHMIPKIAWACRSRVTKYDWKNKNSIDMIEFSVCNASERTVVAANGSPETLKGKGFSCANQLKRSGTGTFSTTAIKMRSAEMFFILASGVGVTR